MKQMEDVLFLSGGSGGDVSVAVAVENHGSMAVQVESTGDCVLRFEGRVSPEADYAALAAINLGNFAVAENVSAAGLYTVGLEGLYDVRCRVQSGSGVAVKARMGV